jgi:hypothetical protein
MRRPVVFILIVGAFMLAAFWALLQTPGSLMDALSHPLRALVGTQQQLNSTLLEVSENGETVRAAGRRLLQPWGVVRLVRIYDTPDPDHSKKR